MTYAEADAAARLDGRWVTPASNRVVLPPRGVRDVAVQVRVPEQVRPGTHLAGLVARTQEPETRTEQVEGGSAAVLEVHVRQVLAVEVRLPGDARAEVTPTRVRYEERTEGPVLVLDGENAGNGLSAARGSVRLSGPASLELPVALDTTVPRTTFSAPLPLARPLPAGRYTALAVLRDASGRTRQLQTAFDVAGTPAASGPRRAVARLPLGGTAPDRVPAPPAAQEQAPDLLGTGTVALALLLTAGFGLLGAVRDRRAAQLQPAEQPEPAEQPGRVLAATSSSG